MCSYILSIYIYTHTYGDMPFNPHGDTEEENASEPSCLLVMHVTLMPNEGPVVAASPVQRDLSGDV